MLDVADFVEPESISPMDVDDKGWIKERSPRNPHLGTKSMARSAPTIAGCDVVSLKVENVERVGPRPMRDAGDLAPAR
jgi:hypothetical protein